MTRRGNHQGSLYRDGTKNRWVAAVSVRGRRIKRSAKTKTEGSRLLAKLINETEQQRIPQNRNISVSELLREWQRRELAGRKRQSTTERRDDWAIRQLEAQLGHKRVQQLSAHDVDDALAALGDTLGAESLKIIRRTIKQALRYGVREEYVTRNVAEYATISTSQPSNYDPGSLTVDEALALQGVLASDRLGALFMLMMTLGLRPGEAMGITWDDIDLDAGQLEVRHAIARDGGTMIHKEALKNRQSIRRLGIPDTTVEALRRHKASQAIEIASQPSWPHPELVFTSSRGGILDPDNVRRRLRALAKKAGIRSLSTNELRHTAASLMYYQGVPLERIADVLGHKDTRMLEKTYRHQIGASIDTAIPVMDNLFSKGEDTPPDQKAS